MKRVIRFRGKRLDNGEWIYGNLVTTDRQAVVIRLDDDCPIDEHTQEIDTSSIGQFTGLLDKNGKEIYEGDIIGIRTCYGSLVPDTIELDALGKSETGTAYFVVKWDTRSARFIKEYRCRKDGMENLRWMNCLSISGNVCGSVFDNPELLK